MPLGGCNMDARKIIAQLKASSLEIIEINQVENLINVKVEKSEIRKTALFLKNELGFGYGSMAFGIDLKEKIEMNWYVGRVDIRETIVIKSSTSREKPVFPSLTTYWKGMDWNEREAYDLLGIEFEGHNDLRRIYMPENWEGYPLREDYVYKKPKYQKPEDTEKK